MSVSGGESWIIFVDTNIYLDFYRMAGEVASRQLKALERHADRIILGDQVRMEFLKNRQKVVIDGMNILKRPAKPQFPQIVAGYDPARMMSKRIAEADVYYKKVKEKIEKVLSDPAQNDDVYKCFNRIFAKNSRLNLRRPDKTRYEVRSLARKRFALGYPPRKSAETSFGDAINWEWIVRCTQDSKENEGVVIVSRDGDYGVTLGGESFLNDWLSQEFKARVSQKRKIRLTQKLSYALSFLDEVVTEEDKKEEEKVIASTSPDVGETPSIWDELVKSVLEDKSRRSSYETRFGGLSSALMEFEEASDDK